MRLFTNEEGAKLSGLSRGQIDQLISRYGFVVYGAKGERRERLFSDTDVFNLMLAGALHAIGLTMPAIRDVLASLGLYLWDPTTDHPAEVYPGQPAPGSGRHCIVLYQVDGDWHAHIVEAAKAGVATGPRGGVAIVIDASGIVERIEEAFAARAIQRIEEAAARGGGER